MAMVLRLQLNPLTYMENDAPFMSNTSLYRSQTWFKKATQSYIDYDAYICDAYVTGCDDFKHLRMTYSDGL